MTIATDELGIMTERRDNRARFARFQRVVPRYELPEALQRKVDKLVSTAVREEVDRLVARGMALAMDRMEGIVPTRGPQVSKILAAVEQATGISVGELTGQRRARRIARPRQLAYHLIRSLRPDLSFPAIGRCMGNRDHTTVLSGVHVFESLKDAPPFTAWLAHPAIVALSEG